MLIILGMSLDCRVEGRRRLLKVLLPVMELVGDRVGVKNNNK